MNQQLNGAEWVLLGTFSLSSAASKVKLVPSADGIVAADAVKAVNTSEAARIFFVHADHLNAPRVVINSANQMRWRWISDPWGQLPPEENPQGLGAFALNLRFPGQVYDIESNLHYNYFRDYDPASGRYVQSDPIGLAGGINTYAYVGGNPISYTDPRGLDNPGMGPYGPWWSRGGVQICCRAAQIAAGLVQHCWVQTPTKSGGMGADPNIPPGQQYEGIGMPVWVNDHSRDLADSCMRMRNVDEQCVDDRLQIGAPAGRFVPPFNQCQSFAYGIVNQCRTGPQIGP